MTLREILRFFIKYKYAAIFPVAVAEGPIITMVSGFLVSRGYLSLLPTLLIVFFGDIISDSFFHFLGKWGRAVIEYLRLVRVSPEKIERIENQFGRSPWKTMMLAKVSYGLGSVFMVASGISRMPLRDFLKYILSLDLIRSYLMLCIGFYFGRAALHLGPTALKYYGAAVIILLPAFYFIYQRRFRKTA